jgi:hypothetical protein
MRKLQIADCILELSMTRDRAASVAGDLREAERGAFWFWCNVFATIIASVWSDFLSAPWRLIRLGLLMTVFGFVFGMPALDFPSGRSSFDLLLRIARRSGRQKIAARLTATVQVFSLTLLGAISALNRPRLVKGFRLSEVPHA